VTELFCGKLLNTVQCSLCGAKSVAFDEFQSLPFTQGLLLQFSLERAIEGFLKEEVLNEVFPCARCKQKWFVIITSKFKNDSVFQNTPTIGDPSEARFRFKKQKLSLKHQNPKETGPGAILEGRRQMRYALTRASRTALTSCSAS